ncbi:MAG TPA: CidA/LrgA family protein [Bacillota bacterium]|nr:CidA/LrgA family protein [Bacillota bacterium]
MKVRRFGVITIQIVGICFFYQLLSWCLNKINLPIPANVLGMVLLFFLLVTGIIPIKWVEEGALYLLKYMPIMFIPYGVAMVTYKDLFDQYGSTIIIILFISSFLAAAITGTSTQLWQKWRQPKSQHQEEKTHASIS